MIWSIGFSISKELFGKDGSVQIQSAADVTDVRALFVADPFLVITETLWHIFTEVLNTDCQKGEIGYHFSSDEGISWQYGKIVVREDWHMSFPFIVEHLGHYYMLTCATSGTNKPYSLWLYSTNNFPEGWIREHEILRPGQTEGRPVDPVLKLHNGVWYLFVLDDGLDKERVFFSNTLLGPFQEHQHSRTYNIRQSGNLVTDENGQLWAFHHTGEIVERWRITNLTETHYSYDKATVLLRPKPGEHWASSGMHTFNAVQVNGTDWAIVVDGWWNDVNLAEIRSIEGNSAFHHK